eukprot:CAMPEP_0174240098 /NCGR_PEP_ID=MMETSP0417-20130205/17423_1 /TAXON_ID=242541 /ORGANISM="Mayorella sp, Strain BSH-02190019" /LENGTH=66 /DNA_ID=CAMNT_0015319129 /DNA_START=39 /DNA_END=236 /DNA_ORIENTATION=-
MNWHHATDLHCTLLWMRCLLLLISRQHAAWPETTFRRYCDRAAQLARLSVRLSLAQQQQQQQQQQS